MNLSVSFKYSSTPTHVKMTTFVKVSINLYIFIRLLPIEIKVHRSHFCCEAIKGENRTAGYFPLSRLSYRS